MNKPLTMKDIEKARESANKMYMRYLRDSRSGNGIDILDLLIQFAQQYHKEQPIEWISVKDRLPELTIETGNSESKWRHSELVVCKYTNDDSVKSQYEIAEYEKGQDWEQWFSPSYDDAIETPHYWSYLEPTNTKD